MKKLFLIRHGKSSWDDAALSDRERPLNDRGEHDARKMAERFAQRNLCPDVILSSPAIRALATAQIAASRLGYKRHDIVVDDHLYAAEVDDVLSVLHALADKLKFVMLFGHNPELAELGHRLSAEITCMPTCAVAEFTFDAKSWSCVGKVEPKTVTLTYPKKP